VFPSSIQIRVRAFGPFWGMIAHTVKMQAVVSPVMNCITIMTAIDLVGISHFLARCQRSPYCSFHQSQTIAKGT
jgi:hypothetical protein